MSNLKDLYPKALGGIIGTFINGMLFGAGFYVGWHLMSMVWH